MKIILIICLVVSLYFILRSSTTAFTHWLGYKYRKETNIEKIWIGGGFSSFFYGE